MFFSIFKVKRNVSIMVFLSVMLIIQAYFSQSFAMSSLGQPVVPDSTYYISPSDLSAQAAILMDADTGQILFEKNAHKIMYPASTTKILTAIVILENEPNLDKVIVVDDKSPYIGGSGIGLQPKEPHTIRELLYALMLASSNASAEVLARYHSGSIEEFSKLMNEKAAEIGALNTNFTNPHGLHHDDHVTTAYDLALITQYAMQNETLMEIVQTKSYTFPANNVKKEPVSFASTNQLMAGVNGSTKQVYYRDGYSSLGVDYMTGMKTGYTGQAGQCFVGTASKDNRNLISVVLNSSGISGRFVDTKYLMDYGFNSFYKTTIYDASDKVQTVTLNNLNKTKIEAFAPNTIDITLRNDVPLSDVQENIQIDPSLNLPLESGDTVGYLTFLHDGESIVASPLTINYDVSGIDLLDDIVTVYPMTLQTSSFNLISLMLKVFIVFIIWRVIMTIINLQKRKYRRAKKKKQRQYLTRESE